MEPILQKVWIIWSPLLYLNFKRFTDPNSSSCSRFQWILHDSGVLFSESWNFYKLKRGDLISWGNQFCRKSELFVRRFSISILQKVWIIWFPLQYFNFKSFMDPNSSSLIRFQCILRDSGSTFLRVFKFLHIKHGGPNFWGEQILQNVWIIWSPLLFSNFKSFLDPNSWSLIRFQHILNE